MNDKKIFSHVKYDEIVNETMKTIVELGKLKGGEYAGDLDRLANFRRNAESLGVYKELVWGVYASKHWDALIQYIKDIAAGKERVRLETLSGRCDDLIVYLLLFKAMIAENNKADEQNKAAAGRKEAGDPRMALSLKQVGEQVAPRTIQATAPQASPSPPAPRPLPAAQIGDTSI